ncbi:MAG: DUF4091 domain-containing protein [Lentisphaeria bacterium]|nr:DUF4091 domain-containing protein [Lentisphaeria bacterium]
MKLILGITAATALSLSAAPQNLIENGSFEAEKCPFAWCPRESITVRCKPENTEGRFISRPDTERVHSGKRSWYHECRVAPGENDMRFCKLKCEYGKMYEFNCFYYIGQKEITSRIWYDVTFFNAEGKVAGFFNGPKMDMEMDQWLPFTIRFFPPKNAVSCDINLKFCSILKVWVDDASFAETDPGAYVKTMGVIQKKTDELTVWSESPLCQAAHSGIPEGVKPGNGVKLAAAANESESFQLVVTPEKPLKALTLKAEGFPDFGFEFRKVGFVNVTNAADPRQLGMNADPLLAVTGPVSAEPGKNCPFFITVKIPSGTKKGTYSGQIRLYDDGRELAAVPLTVRVWGAALPERTVLSTAFYTSPGFGGGAYLKYDKRPKQEIVDDLHSLLKAMRISCNQAADIASPKWKKVNGSVVVTDWTRCDESIRKLRDQYHFHDIRIPMLRMLGDNGGWFKSKGRKTKVKWGRTVGAEPPATPFGSYYDAPDGIKYVSEYARQFLDHTKKEFPDVRFFWYIYDEVPGDNFHQLIPIMKEIKKQVPDITLMIVGGRAELPEYDIQTDSFNRPAVRTTRDNYKEKWYYQWKNSISPAQCMAARAFAWQIYAANGKGGLLWNTINCGSRKQTFNPWDSPTERYDSAYPTIFYPPYQGKGGAVPSQRAWLIRDGIEDYELLILAERKIGREKVLELIKPFIKDPFTWVNDPAVLNEVRAKLAEAAE